MGKTETTEHYTELFQEIQAERLRAFMQADRAFVSGRHEDLARHEKWLNDLDMLKELYEKDYMLELHAAVNA